MPTIVEGIQSPACVLADLAPLFLCPSLCPLFSLKVNERCEEREVPKAEARARKILHGLGFDPPKQDALTHTFSGMAHHSAVGM